jgi:glutathione peroxidase-family protein
VYNDICAIELRETKQGAVYFKSIYSITVKDSKGEDVGLSEYTDKVLLIVNTATGCGFTPQYAGLQDLYVRYRDRGFEILDFPCNQFANQAPERMRKSGVSVLGGSA